jgi:hypothetical protein
MNRRGDRDGDLDKGRDDDLWTGAVVMATEEAATTWSQDGSRGGGCYGGRKSGHDGNRRGLNSGKGRGGLKKLISLNPNP